MGVSRIKLSEEIKEMTKDKIWQQENKRGVLIIKLNKYSITWFIIIKHIYNKIISCLWFLISFKTYGWSKTFSEPHRARTRSKTISVSFIIRIDFKT